jgi:hypothetical protein
MIAILIGAGVSGVVLGATSRIIFLLPAALMALVVGAVLIVRADIDLGFTALAATLLNGGFLLGAALARAMPRRGRNRGPVNALAGRKYALGGQDAGAVKTTTILDALLMGAYAIERSDEVAYRSSRHETPPIANSRMLIAKTGQLAGKNRTSPP